MAVTLGEQFIIDQQAKVPGATGVLSTVINRISLAGRMIALEIMRAGFVGKLGLTGDVNVQDEEVRALDAISNEIFQRVFANMHVVHAMASEEMEDIAFVDGGADGKYLILYDPLDGSGNVEVDGPMGTIFSVLRRPDDGRKATVDDFLRKGSEQVAAGYILYGPATMFVYTVGGGKVHGFTLDRAIGTFFVTHPDIRFPEDGKKASYAVNEANASKWPAATRRMVEAFRNGETRCGKRAARYSGALVFDFHRTLLQGGIYMYPGEEKKPEGKLRLLYEANPLAMVARHAGGMATDGEREILDLQPTKLHQRCPLFIGSRADVEEAMRLMRG
ncbi:MAG TPA: class 1 fructose-bisphosphatase [Planctomycetota bacterium]|nr:class 1 fructose-bisphosphatase [Planctomycetota bacterium]